MKTSRTKATACLRCGIEVDAMTDLEAEKSPHPGAVTLCIQCGHAHVVTEDLGLRQPTPQEKHVIDAQDDVRRYRRAIALRKAERG